MDHRTGAEQVEEGHKAPFLEVPVQHVFNPDPFDYNQLVWSKARLGGHKTTSFAARFPKHRLENFLQGECHRGSCHFRRSQRRKEQAGIVLSSVSIPTSSVLLPLNKQVTARQVKCSCLARKGSWSLCTIIATLALKMHGMIKVIWLKHVNEQGKKSEDCPARQAAR